MSSPGSQFCLICLRAQRTQALAKPSQKAILSRNLANRVRLSSSSTGAARSENGQEQPAIAPSQHASNAKPEPGPMARRLEEATEDALLTGGTAGRRAVEDAGFSDELKERLLNKLADAQFRMDNASAFNQAGLGPHVPRAAGRGTQDLAAATPWTGEEATSDAVLRMLNDAHKPLAPGLRGKSRTPEIVPRVVDMRLRREPVLSPGQKAASARDRASAYTEMGLKDSEEALGLDEKDREARRQEFRERFGPGVRVMPKTVTGLAALANERIENAISRGQFKNIPRGKGVERDARADNPFIDTTEYIMNKMIQRQDIVPPWIEKQQEVAKTASIFRSRLRNDWKRHAARMISSRGGSLEEQMSRAAEYARAEQVHNPRKRNVDEIAVPSNSTDDAVMAKLRQKATDPATPEETPAVSAEPEITLSKPFRDPAWEATERSYMELAITNLNAITRSYNLMAPELAKKPYFSLERELNSCYADVAPQLAEVIRDRATRPAKAPSSLGTTPRSVLDRFAGESSRAKVYDSRAPHYGLKEMWRDLFSRPS